MDTDVLKTFVTCVLIFQGTMSKESKFCFTKKWLAFPIYCGKTTIECDQGYVINVVEVEKGDYSTCIGCECCDETSVNAVWTDMMKIHCNGKRTCDTHKVRNDTERAIKTIYNCIQEHFTTEFTSNITSSSTVNQPSTIFETAIPSSEPTTCIKSESSIEPSSPTASSTKLHTDVTISMDEESFPVAVTVAIPAVAVSVVLIILMVLVYKKRRAAAMSNSSKTSLHQNKQNESNRDIASSGEALATGDAVTNNAEASVQYINITYEINNTPYVNLHVRNEGHYEKLSEQLSEKDTYSSLNF